MTLIKSISGIRGTIGGKQGEGLTALDTVKFTAAYGEWLKKRFNKTKVKVVIGRDARISGRMVRNLVVGTLQSLGIDVVDLGLSTTPTVEIAVPEEKAHGGIIITASHNPAQWNALKLLNEKGEFISANDGEEVLKIAEKEDFTFVEVNDLGSYSKNNNYMAIHIDKVKQLELVNEHMIKAVNLTIVVDAVNSSGGVFIPTLLHELGVNKVIEVNCEPTGNFAHNPEPLPENLTEISKAVIENNANLGIVVDPDVDRLAFICEDGTVFGEEYTLVSIADYVLENTKGATVSNLSSTRALQDVTENNGCEYHASAVGEVNVVAKMKEVNAVIGGEGNGGIIYPELHYGRDALVGIGLFLTHLAQSGTTVSSLRAACPNYFISKNKIELTPEIDVDLVLQSVKEKYANEKISTIDGVKIMFDKQWVHLRKSNTEPIIRIYSESETKAQADALANKIINDIKTLVPA